MLLGPPDAAASEAPPTPRAAGDRIGWSGVDALDAVIGLAVGAVDVARRAADLPLVGGPVRAVAAVPGSLARAARAQSWVDDLVGRGDRERQQAMRRAHAFARRVAPGLVDSLLDLVDVTELVRRHVDLDALAAGLDVDAVVARADLQKAIDRVDIDGVVAGVDLQRVIDRIDVDAIVAGVDFDAVIAKLDLIELAEFVVEGIDLPGIIRSSTGSMASEGLREVRRQGIGADERVAHVVDRLLHRQERAPGQPLPRAGGGQSAATPEQGH